MRERKIWGRPLPDGKREKRRKRLRRALAAGGVCLALLLALGLAGRRKP